jgi:hypothetical protein
MPVLAAYGIDLHITDSLAPKVPMYHVARYMRLRPLLVQPQVHIEPPNNTYMHTGNKSTIPNSMPASPENTDTRKWLWWTSRLPVAVYASICMLAPAQG